MQNKCASEDGSLRSSEDGGSELTFSIVLGTVEGIKAIFSKFNLNALLVSHFSRQFVRDYHRWTEECMGRTGIHVLGGIRMRIVMCWCT